MSRVIDTAKHARYLTQVGREAAQRIPAGQHGEFVATLSVGGLSDQRREELISALEAELGVKRMPPVGDGAWRLRGWLTPGVSMQVGAAHVLGYFAGLMHDIGFEPSELLAGDVELEVRPASPDDPPPPALRREPKLPAPVKATGKLIGRILGDRTHRKLSHLQHGLAVAAADNADQVAMRATGEREFAVFVDVDGLTAQQTDALSGLVRQTLGQDPRRLSDDPRHDGPDDALLWLVRCVRVGTGMGAILLTVRKLADIFEQVPPTATVTLTAREADPDADANDEDRKDS